MNASRGMRCAQRHAVQFVFTILSVSGAKSDRSSPHCFHITHLARIGNRGGVPRRLYGRNAADSVRRSSLETQHVPIGCLA